MCLLYHLDSGAVALLALVSPGLCLEYRMLTSRADARFHQDSIKKRLLEDMSLICLRKCEGKAAPLSRASALHADLAAHGLRKLAGDGQTDAGAAKGARARPID